MQYSLVNIVWGTASTGGYGGTVFPGGEGGYDIHWDTGFTLTPATQMEAQYPDFRALSIWRVDESSIAI